MIFSHVNYTENYYRKNERETKKYSAKKIKIILNTYVSLKRKIMFNKNYTSKNVCKSYSLLKIKIEFLNRQWHISYASFLKIEKFMKI